MNFDPATHRKTVKHFDEPGHAHELTFSCYQRLSLLVDDDRCEMLALALDRALEHHRYDLHAYVFMPEHVHLLVQPQPSASSIAGLLYAIKRPFSYRVKQLMVERNDSVLAKLTVTERPSKKSFRFWQEGPGFDRNVVERTTAIQMIEYIHLNPVRRRLCASPAQYRWSSWSAYFRPGCCERVLPKVQTFPVS
jgi:putative transposase